MSVRSKWIGSVDAAAIPGELAHVSLIVNDEECLHARSRLVGRQATPYSTNVA